MKRLRLQLRQQRLIRVRISDELFLSSIQGRVFIAIKYPLLPVCTNIVEKELLDLPSENKDGNIGVGKIELCRFYFFCAAPRYR